MPKLDAAAELAGKMVQTLERLCEPGDDAYPPTLAQLAALADPLAPLELASKALKKKPFAARLLAANKHTDSPVALTEDAERLADSPRLVEFTLALLCTPEKRLHPSAKLVGKVDKSLKAVFTAALQRHLAQGSLPATVGVVTVRGKPQLYLRTLPPPAVELSQKLMRALEALRAEGENAYPLSLKELIARADTAAGPTLVKEATALPPFAGRTLSAAPRDSASPLALTEDRDVLLGSAVLLEYAVIAVRKPDHQAVSLADLKKKVAKPLQAAFETALMARIAAGKRSPTVGWLYVKKKPHLFLFADLNVAPPSQASGGRKPPDPSAVGDGMKNQGAYAPRSPVAVDFAAAFGAAFDQLNRQKGSHNIVSLVDLRRAVQVDRAAFNDGLQQLRRAGRYTLSNAEGRHGITAEEREAGLVEEGALLLFVSRKIH
jgi:hypothetical protein